MRKEDIASDLPQLAFDFFYWFSRFEFALKENAYLKSHVIGAKAEASWDDFVMKWGGQYAASGEALSLLEASPESQIIAANDQLAWKTVGLTDCKSELEKVVRLLKTIRNNLFHGGKHGGAGWDDSKRTAFLLSSGKTVLDQLAALALFDADYTGHY